MCTLVSAIPIGGADVATYDFEDGTARAGSRSLTPPLRWPQCRRLSGPYSLLTSTSSSGTGGPSISLSGVLLPGAKYTITGYVRLTSGESAATPTSPSRAAIPRAPAAPATTPSAPTRCPSTTPVGPDRRRLQATTTETGALLYAQLVGAPPPQSFYLDDVVITADRAASRRNPCRHLHLSDGGLDGWTPFGSATLTNACRRSPIPPATSTACSPPIAPPPYMGPSLNLLSVNNIVAGATYQVSAYVLLAAPDSANPTATMSTKTADCATSGAFSNLATSAALSSTAWTKVQGTFSFSNLPGPPTEPDALLPVEQRDGFLLHQRRGHQRSRAAAARPQPAGQLRHHHQL